MSDWQFIYPINTNIYINVLLIDNTVTNYQQLIDSANSYTFPIVYSTSSSKAELLLLLRAKFTAIQRIGICFASIGIPTQLFLDSEPFFLNSEPPYNNNTQFIVDIITNFNVANIDYLACNTLMFQGWKNYYDILSQQTSVVVGASNNSTGNIQYGGDWIMESTCQDIESIYFTQNINYYAFLLDASPQLTFIIKNDNTVWGCGQDQYSQFGDGRTDWVVSSLRQITIPSGKTVASVTAGNLFSMYLMTDGTVYGAGYNDVQTGLGMGYTSTNPISTLTKVTSLPSDKTPVYLCTSGLSTFVLMTDGTLYVAGWNGWGQFGVGNTVDTTSFSLLNTPGGLTVMMVSSSFANMYLVLSDGTIWSCGWNAYGQLGIGSTSTTAVTTFNNVTIPGTGLTVNKIYSGYSNFVVLMSDGSLWGCGRNSYSNLGYLKTVVSVTTLTNMPLPVGKTVSDVAIHGTNTFLQMTDGTLYGAGLDDYNQFGMGVANPGQGNTYTVFTKIPIPGGLTVLQHITSTFTGLVLLSDNQVYGTGQNNYGNLGLTNTTMYNSYTLMPNSSNTKTLLNQHYLTPVVIPPPQIIISNSCFPTGTPVITNLGPVAIDKLDPNIHTIRNRTIIAITQNITLDKYVVCFEKDAIDTNVPDKQTIISKRHLVMYKGKMIQADKFVGHFGDNITRLDYNGEILYNVLMEDHDKMIINNLICETLHPKNTIAQIYRILPMLSPCQRDELIRDINFISLNQNVNTDLINQNIFQTV